MSCPTRATLAGFIDIHGFACDLSPVVRIPVCCKFQVVAFVGARHAVPGGRPSPIDSVDSHVTDLRCAPFSRQKDG
jgi:hypothetical protein